MSGYDPTTQTRIDMQNARGETSFNVQQVRNMLWNGQQEWDKHVVIVNILSNDPAFDKSQRQYMSRQEQFRRGLAMIRRLSELEDIHKWSPRDAALALSWCGENLPIQLHMVAFLPPLLTQGSDDLIEKYGALATHRGILGAYAQTELGHGTNVAGLETTSTFLQETREFEIHSPTLSSSKFWIGGSGSVATHAVVQARLLMPSGADMGPHLFLVQLRSLKDHRPQPGITIGDIGPKAFGAVAANDNGFIRFNKVRIPHESMLRRFAGISDSGEYVKPPHSKLSYGGMLSIRSGMITSAGWQLAKAITIAVRYTTVRRQGGTPREEQQVIKYPSVYSRLLPIIAECYVYILLGRNISKGFEAFTEQLRSGDTTLLAETHAILSALKVLVSASSVNSIEVARRSMGGHGFTAAAGVGRLYADHVPSTTYEGDNFVLDQQVVRAAVKALERYLNEKSPQDRPSSAYLRMLRSKPVLPTQWSNSERSVLLLEQRAAAMVQAYKHTDAAHDITITQRTSKAVGEAFVAAKVREMIHDTSLGGSFAVVRQLLHLYLLTRVEAALADLLAFNLIKSGGEGGDPAAPLRSQIAAACATILPNAIGLTDAFGFTDWELDSALGVESGNVYEELWKSAQLEPLNRPDVAEGYEEFIKPVLERGQRLAAGGKAKL